MGTNFYLYRQGENLCPHCGRSDDPEKIHIGKSSGGWCFSLHVYPEEGIYDLDDWIPQLFNGTIEDEYGDVLTPDQMIELITDRKWHRSWLKEGMSEEEKQEAVRRERKFYEQNYAEPGPNGLVRHKLMPGHCISHGEGTWDCIIGEFS